MPRANLRRSPYRALSRRQAGNVSIVFALTLPILLWFMAMVADLGHGWQVRNQLQNAADGAALAGVRMLDGTSTGVGNVSAAISTVAGAHNANGTSVTILSSDIQYGSWDFTNRTFTNLGSGYSPSTSINAIKVVARRDGSTSTVATWFASALGGASSMSVTATAIAAGGAPTEASKCAFPVTFASCALVDSSGNFTCPGGNITYNKDNGDAGITIFTTSAGNVNGQAQETLITDALAGNCTSGIDTGSSIYVQNGNDPTQNSVNAINNYVAANGPFEADMPIVDVSDCSHVVMNRAMTLKGWMHVKITGATWPTPKAITIAPNCTITTVSDNGLPGGGYYGEWSTNPYLVQ